MANTVDIVRGEKLKIKAETCLRETSFETGHFFGDTYNKY